MAICDRDDFAIQLHLVFTLAFSPGGARLVAGDLDGGYRILETAPSPGAADRGPGLDGTRRPGH